MDGIREKGEETDDDLIFGNLGDLIHLPSEWIGTG